MKKLLFLTALALIGCDNYTTGQESNLIEKKVVVHDTITKYRTHECSREYGVSEEIVDGDSWVVEIRKKRDDEIVYYVQPLLIAKRINEQGGSNFNFDSYVDKVGKDLFIYISFITGKEKHSFYKVWPQSNYYMVETHKEGFNAGSLTITNPLLPMPK